MKSGLPLLLASILCAACFGEGKYIHLNDPDGGEAERVRLNPDLFDYHIDIRLNTGEDGVQISESVSEIPILIRLRSDNFDFNAAHEQGADIRFSNAEGELLDHEVESWSVVRRTADIWVSIDDIVPDDPDQFITLHYGNATPSDLPALGPVFSLENGFSAVFHLSDNALNYPDGFKDATPENHDATASNLRPETGSVSGVAGEAISLRGSAYLTNKSLLGTPSAVTLSAWLNLRGDSEGTVVSIGDAVILTAESSALTGKFYDGSGWRGITAAVSLEDTWHHVTYVVDPAGAVQKLFIDGTAVAEQTGKSSISYTLGYEETTIGVHTDKDKLFLDADLDELRISRKPRAADWILLDVASQRLDNSSLVVF